METKFGAPVELETKAVTESNDFWTVTGYASIFGNRDLGGDVVMPGAFAKSLREHGLPIILFQHKVEDVPVGTCVEAREDRRGLFIKTELPRDDEFVAGRLVPQLKRRGLRGMSIGYRAIETERRKEDGARLLKALRLYECSFVSMPMNEQAGVETIKTMSADDLIDALEQLGRSARELAEAARADPITDLIRLTKSMRAFVTEARRDRPQLRDPITRAEGALRQAQARLDRLRSVLR
jgi:uncharacterized protein